MGFGTPQKLKDYVKRQNKAASEGDVTTVYKNQHPWYATEDPENKDKQKKAAADAENNRQSQLGDTQTQLKKFQSGDTDYLNSVKGAQKAYQDQRQGYMTNYLNSVNSLKSQAESQSTDAQKVYSDQIQPQFKSLMEQAGQNAKSAMTLSEAGDVNNSVQTAVRGLYEKQAKGIGKQSLQDQGVLAALGAQATQSQLGGSAPLTGSQLQLLNSQNQAQGGAAYAAAQQRMDALRQQGLTQGFNESSNQYQRGVQAQQLAGQQAQSYQNAQGVNEGQQQGYRNEIGGYNSDIFGTNIGAAREDLDMSNQYGGLQHDLAGQEGNRQLAYENMKYGGDQQAFANQIAQANAENAQKAAIMSGILQAGGAAAGGYYGGAQGAKAGGSAGGAFGNALGQGGQYNYQNNYNPYQSGYYGQQQQQQPQQQNR